LNRAPLRRPPSVNTALGLLVAVLVFGLARIVFLDTLPVNRDLPTWFNPSVVTVSFLVNALLIYAIETGRRWALIVSVALFVVGVPMSVRYLREASVSLLAVSVAQLLMAVAAYLLLFTSAARRWFRAVRELKSQPPGLAG
jgi:hypothetical protein